MLNPVMKNRRRKRRKRKQPISSAAATTVARPDDRHSAQSGDSREFDEQQSRTSSPRVSSKFINEDVEVETSIMLKHLNRDSEILRKKEYDLKFFVLSLSVAELLDLSRSQTAIDYRMYKVDVVDQSGEPSAHDYAMDGPQLSSFYVNDDFTDIVKPFQQQQLDDSGPLQFYVPKLALPTRIPVDVEAPNDQTPALPEYGHYAQPRPNVLRTNYAQLMNRLIEEGAFQWLDIHGRQMRHVFDVNASRRLIQTTCAERFHPIECRLMDVAYESDAILIQDRILCICLQDITFDGHPAFDDEQRVARELELLYDEYVRHDDAAMLHTIETKLSALRQLLDTIAGQARVGRTTANDNVRAYRDELRELRGLWHRESAKQRELLQKVLEHWTKLKKVRERATVPSTGVKLVIKAHEPNADRDTYEWSHRFSVELNETLSDEMIAYREQKQRKQKAEHGASKVPKPNANAVADKLSEVFAKSMRPPGEPVVDIKLERTEHAPNKNLPKYVVRIQLDNGHLQFPDSHKLNSFGQALINARYSIKFTTRIPQRLRFLVFEKSHLHGERKIAEFNAAIPSEDEPFRAAAPITKAFTTKPYAGKVTFCIGWSTLRSDTRWPEPRSPAKLAAATTNLEGTVGAWFCDQLIDPMDPQNATLTKIVDNSAVKRSAGHEKRSPHEPPAVDSFRLHEDAYAFCSRHKFNENKRIDMLNARFNSDLKLKDCKLIPHTEVEIEIPVDLKMFEDMLWVDPIDVQRYQGKKYLKHIYDIITNHCEVINRDMEHRDLLIGDTPPTLYGALEAFTNIFSPRRPLNPHRKTFIRRSNFREDSVSRFNVIVNVVRASGIPYRGRDEVVSSRRTSLMSSIQNIQRHANVRPFVTVTFRDKMLRTSTVDSSNPTWNEQIVLPISESISQIKDALWFHVFDEIIEDLPSNDNPTSASEICQKISSHYLGELMIPFSTIYASQRIEGTFQMTTPLILLGYTKPTVNVPDLGADSMGGSVETRQSILISLLISIEPIIEIGHFSTGQLECIELNAVQYRIRQWLNEFTEEFPLRAQDPLVSLANGKRVCITRLIGAIDIPFERNETSEYMIRRFVSLIPVRLHKNVCTKLNGIWLTNDQVLNILIASPKDLGVLLTCYYLSLGYDAYLVLGFAIPYGDTTFTLIRDAHEYHLIDPHSGRKCSTRDTFGALTKVYCLANQRNVWANIQREHRVFMQNFDTTQSTEWLELFTRACPAPHESVHDLQLPYTNSLDCDNLRRSIEMKIMKKFAVWRMDRQTVWNRRYADLMLGILRELEQDRCFDVEQKVYVDRLIDATQARYRATGYPINMPYISIPKIVERIKATEVHLSTTPNVEFSLAVYIQSYPMNIFSVWAFILVLAPRAE